MLVRLPVEVKANEASELRLKSLSVTLPVTLLGVLLARMELRSVIAPPRLAIPPPKATPVLVSPTGPGAASLRAIVTLIRLTEFETTARAPPRPSPRDPRYCGGWKVPE